MRKASINIALVFVFALLAGVIYVASPKTQIFINKLFGRNDLPDCRGFWRIHRCRETGKKTWVDIRKYTGGQWDGDALRNLRNQDEPCKEKIPHGAEADCVRCSGYFGPCIREGDDAIATFVRADNYRNQRYDYCPMRRSCFCEGEWDTSACSDSGKKTWTNKLTPDCLPKHEDGFKADC